MYATKLFFANRDNQPRPLHVPSDFSCDGLDDKLLHIQFRVELLLEWQKFSNKQRDLCCNNIFYILIIPTTKKVKDIFFHHTLRERTSAGC